MKPGEENLFFICERLQADHSEKPSIINLMTMLAEKMVKKYDTVAVSRMVSQRNIFPLKNAA